MQQTVIKVGNSLAVTIPSSFVNETKLKAGEKVMVVEDVDSATLTMQPLRVQNQREGLTPEFLLWLKKFNKRYKEALTELAKK